MWGIRGRILPMSDQPGLGSTKAFIGRVWIADDGTIAAVTRGTAAGPPGSAGATVVDVGSRLVVPGLIDLHNHLAYNTLPLWAEPTQRTPFLHHNSWPRARSYAASTTWPAYAFITAAPAELLAYVETKAIVGGCTSIQGSPPMNKPRDGWMVRNIDDETFGTGNSNLVYASVLTADSTQLAARANAMRTGSAFIYHCAEGSPGSIVAREYDAAAAAGCLQSRFVAVHANAVDSDRFADWTEAGAIAWSPFSNLWLYGKTTDVVAARAAGISVCLGSDWAPSGTSNVLGELKSARLTSDALGLGLSDADIVAMATSTPGDVLARAWNRQLGRLQPGAIADLVVLDTAARANPFKAVVDATEDDVELVVVDGKPRYGTKSLMAATPAPRERTTSVKVGARSMRLALTRVDAATSSWTWSMVVDRLNEVRADPKAEIEQADAVRAAWSGRLDDVEAPLRIALDMPTGVGPVGGLPKDLGQIVIPPLAPLRPDAAWLASIPGRGFHDGVLDGLAQWYR